MLVLEDKIDQIERVLVIGSGGMVARAWQGVLTAHRVPFDVLARPELDLASPEATEALDCAGYRLVVNAAAWTDVDGAESREDDATRVNGDAVGSIARACVRSGSTLVHYSTDYVFDGAGQRPYLRDAPTAPISAYGRSKEAGERAIRASGARAYTVRTSWVYAPWGKNFVRTIAGLAACRDRLAVVDDQRGRPTSAEHLARATLALVMRADPGVWHVCDGGDCTWYDLACAIVAGLGAPCAVDPCGSEAYPRPAPRPGYSVLDLCETEAVIGPMPCWQDNVTDVLRRLRLRELE